MPKILKEGQKTEFSLTKEIPLQLGLLPISQSSYSIFGSLTFRFFSTSKKVFPYIKLVMEQKDPVATALSYDFLCDNWTSVGLGGMGDMSELTSLTKEFGLNLDDNFLRGYQCACTYKQNFFKPGVYALSLFYNHSSLDAKGKKGKKGEKKSKSNLEKTKELMDEIRANKGKNKNLDFMAFAEEFGVNVAVTASVGIDIFSLLLTVICFAFTSSSWAFAEFTYTVDVFMILFVLLQLGSVGYFGLVDGVSFFLLVGRLITVFAQPVAFVPLLFPTHTILMYQFRKNKFSFTNKLKYAREVLILVGLSFFSMYSLLNLLHLHTRRYLLLTCLLFAMAGNLLAYVVHVRRRGTRKASSEEIDFDALREERRRSVMDILRRGELKIRRERKAKRARVRALLLKRQQRQERAAKGLPKKRRLTKTFFGLDYDSTSEDEQELDKLLHHSGYLGVSSSEEEETDDEEEEGGDKKEGDGTGNKENVKDGKEVKEKEDEKNEDEIKSRKEKEKEDDESEKEKEKEEEKVEVKLKIDDMD